MFEGIYKDTIDTCNQKNIFKIIPEFNEIHQQFSDVQIASKLPLYFYGDHFTKKWISSPYQDQFAFCWDVETLKRLINQNKCQIVDFPIKELDHKYDDLYSPKVEQYKFQEEIDSIIVIGFYETFIVVDGNHRLQSRIIRGKKSIKGYFVPYQIYTKAFYTKESLAEYILFHNLNMLKCICSTKILLFPFYINQSFKSNSFYSKKYDIKISPFKRIRIIINI